MVAPDAGCPPTTGASRVDASGWILVRQAVMARTASAVSSSFWAVFEVPVKVVAIFREIHLFLGLFGQIMLVFAGLVSVSCLKINLQSSELPSHLQPSPAAWGALKTTRQFGDGSASV